MAELSISNIGWLAEQDDAVYSILKKENISLEVAPTRFWPNWQGASVDAALAQKASIPVPVTSFQALLFQADLHLFRDGEEGREKLFNHLAMVMEMASVMCSVTAPALVFGSPKQRLRGALPIEEAERIAVNFFRRVGDFAVRKGVVLCLEPNPTHYGADFMTTADEAARVVRRVGSPGIRLSLDTGCAALQSDDIYNAIIAHADILHHFQTAEKDLGTFANPQSAHAKAAAGLFGMGYNRMVSIEMRGTGDQSIENITQAIRYIRATYDRILRKSIRVCIVGGGWFGCHLASCLDRSGATVVLHEAKDQLFDGSSSKNQFRLHLGFHYPRSFKTRQSMQVHFYRFHREYQGLAEPVPNNFYAIANNDSFVDFGTYLNVLGAMGIPFEIEEAEKLGVQNVEGIVRAGEYVFHRYSPGRHFESSLKHVVRLNSPITRADVVDLGDNGVSVKGEQFDWIIDCTYHTLRLFQDGINCFYEVCLSLVYEDLHPFNEDELALTIMDGKLCSLYPMLVPSSPPGKRFVTLTSVEYTPMCVCSTVEELRKFESDKEFIEREVTRRRPLFENCFKRFFPGFDGRFKYSSYFISTKTKPVGASDNRECFVSRDSRKIDVWSGKINAIFDAEHAVSNIVGLPFRMPLGKRVALIGFSGFVGSTLARQGQFTHFFNSKNIESIRGCHFDAVYCAGAPGVKWKANKFPEEDKVAIHKLMQAIMHVETDLFVLLSTIDVYPNSNAPLEEHFPCDSVPGHHAYGRHRYELEQFCVKRFPGTSLIVRLPAVFGAGLRKNYIYDMIVRNNIDQIDPSTKFQWYCLDDLANDILTVLARNSLAPANQRVNVINLFPEPIVTSDIIKECFPELVGKTKPESIGFNMVYDLRTSYGRIFAASADHYIRTAKEIQAKLKSFVKAELAFK